MDILMQTFFVVAVLHLSSVMPEFFPYSRLILPAGLYVFLYRFLYSIYRNIIHPRIIYKKLLGQWVYLLKSDTTGLKVFGMFDIKSSDGELKAKSGQAWYYGDSGERIKRGTWYSSLVKADENSVAIMYKMIIQNLPPCYTNIAKGGEYSGAMLLQLIEKPSQKMEGPFSCLIGTTNLEQGKIYAINASLLKEKINENNIEQFIKNYFKENINNRQENIYIRKCYQERRAIGKEANQYSEDLALQKEYREQFMRINKDRRNHTTNCVFFSDNRMKTNTERIAS